MAEPVILAAEVVEEPQQPRSKYRSTKFYPVPRIESMRMVSSSEEHKLPFKLLVVLGVTLTALLILVIILFAVPGFVTNFITPEISGDIADATDITLTVVGPSLTISGSIKTSIKNNNFFPVTIEDPDIQLIKGTLEISTSIPETKFTIPGKGVFTTNASVSAFVDSPLDASIIGIIGVECLSTSSVFMTVTGSFQGEYTVYQRSSTFSNTPINIPC